MNSIIDAQNDLYIEIKKLLPEGLSQAYSHGKYSDKAMADLINSSKSDLLEKKLRTEANLLTERTVIFQSRIGIPVTRTTKLYHYHDPTNRLFYP